MNFLDVTIMSRICRIFSLLLVSLFLTACDKETYVDYESIDYIVLENKSSHNITIKRVEDTKYPLSNSYIPESITIESGKSYKLYVAELKQCADFGTATFDDVVMIDYHKAPMNSYNITSTINYFVQKLDKAKYYFHYIYTFIDADYEFAKEYGTNLDIL